MEKSTTFKIGFDADTKALQRTNKDVERLRKSFDRLAQSVNQTSKATGGMQAPATPGMGKPQTPISGMLGQIPGGGKMAVVARMGLPGLAAGAAVAGIGLMAGAVKEAVSYRLSLDGVYKQLHLSKDAQADFNARLKETAHSLGMARSELAPLERQYIALAGAMQGVTRIQDQIHIGGRLARGFGMDVGQALPRFGQLAQSGAYGGLAGPGGLNMRDFAFILADAVSRGSMKGREGELIDSIHSLVNVQLQTLTRPQNVPGIVGMMTGLSSTNEPGLIGSRGAQLLARISESIRNPENSLSEFIQYQAFGGGDWYDYQRRKEEGAFGESNNLESILSFYQKSMPDKDARHYAMSRHLGISMNQAEALEKGLRNIKLSGDDHKGFVDALRNAAGGTERIERMDFGKLPILAELYKAQSPEAIKNLLTDERIGFDGKKIASIMDSADPIKTAMAEVINANMKLTEGEKIQTEMAKLTNTLTTLGDKSIPALTGTLETLTGGIDALASILAPKQGDKDALIHKAGDMIGNAPSMTGPFTLPMQLIVAALKAGREDQQKAKPADELAVSHRTEIYIDGVLKHTREGKAVGNGSSSKVVVPAD